MTPLSNPIIRDAAAKMQTAMQSNDAEVIKQAWENFGSAVADSIKQDYEVASGDRSALLQRGYRLLTGEEKKFYQSWIDNAKSNAPRQEFTDLLNGGMPETIIEDIYKNLVNDHPLLNAITFTNVSYMTKWLMSDRTVDAAVWGPINSEVAKKISSSFKMIEMTQCKLSCYAAIPKDMLELGPTFLDAYIRTILVDAIACGLENAIVCGDGKNKPIGLDRNIKKGVAVSDGKYPKKTAVKIKSFMPVEYGGIIAYMCKTENGVYRKVDGVGLICNPVDYFKRVMPATTVANMSGTYTKDVFPVPTTVFQSAELTEGEAILFLPEEYFMGLGSSKEGTITFDDSVQFLEDNRVYLIKLFANGRAFDDTVAVLLDISELDPAFITVLNKTEAVAASQSEVVPEA